MKIRLDYCCLVGILALVLLVPGCKKPKANTQDSSQGGGSNFSAPDPGGTVQHVRQAAVRSFTLNEMHQLATWYQFYVSSNNTPPKLDTLAQDREMSSLYKAVKDGDLIVIWPQQATTSAVVLAYPKNAAELQSIPMAFCDGTPAMCRRPSLTSSFLPGNRVAVGSRN